MYKTITLKIIIVTNVNCHDQIRLLHWLVLKDQLLMGDPQHVHSVRDVPS